jgi:cellobiose-specific phosphotransferase system component IIC
MIHGTARFVLFLKIFPFDFSRVTSSEDTIASSLKSAKYTLAISSNMIMTLIAMFGIGYYASYKQGYSRNQVNKLHPPFVLMPE